MGIHGTHSYLSGWVWEWPWEPSTALGSKCIVCLRDDYKIQEIIIKSSFTGKSITTHWIIGFSPASIWHFCSVRISGYRLPVCIRSSMRALSASLIGSHRIPGAVVAPPINYHLLLWLCDAPYGCASGCGCPSCSGAGSDNLGRVAVLPMSLWVGLAHGVATLLVGWGRLEKKERREITRHSRWKNWPWIGQQS